MTAPPAAAEDGEIVHTIEADAGACEVGVGLAFDGSNLMVSCAYDNVIDLVDPDDGSHVGAITVSGMSGIGAMAWDRGRNQLWVCGGFGDRPDTVFLVDPDTGVADEQFTTDGCVDGLAYDGLDDTFWTSDDVSPTVQHYDRDGDLIEEFSIDGKIGSCGSSGIAVGGEFLLLANNGCSQIFKSRKDLEAPTEFGTYPARLEDLECDDVTFAAEGRAVIWSKDAYDNILNAFELNPGDCGYGGFSSPLVLSPQTQVIPRGTPRTPFGSARLVDPVEGTPIEGVSVDFAVASGPNAGEQVSCYHLVEPDPGIPFPLPVKEYDFACLTDEQGVVNWEYDGSGDGGVDQVVGEVTVGGILVPVPSCPTFTCTYSGAATVRWAEPVSYVSLGDSYSAGEGQPPYGWPAPDSPQHHGRCHRSENGYPLQVETPGTFDPVYELASEPDSGVRFEFLACSGAVTENVRTDGRRQHTGASADDYFDEPDTQLNQGPPNEPNDVDLITMSIGGNDIFFSKIVEICATDFIPFIGDDSGSCLDPDDEVMEGQPLEEWAPAKIDSLLRTPEGDDGVVPITYRQIREQYPDATVVIVGYPHLFPDSDEEQTCFKLHPWLGEQDFLNDMGDRLDSTLEQAADEIGVHYISMDEPFADHEICGNGGEWLDAVDMGGAVWEPVGEGSFHPNKDGYTAYADAINDYLRQTVSDGWPLTDNGLPKNPSPVLGGGGGGGGGGGEAFAAPAAIPGDTALGDLAELDVRPPGGFTPVCPSNARSYRPGQTLDVTGGGFAPGSEVSARFYSNASPDPVELGTVSADGAGNVSVGLEVPDPERDVLARYELRGFDPEGVERLALDTFGVAAGAPICTDDPADVTPPNVTIASPIDGATYDQDENVTASFVCQDEAGGSGIGTCTGTVDDGQSVDTTELGSHTFEVEAVDNAGNATTASVTYTVVDTTPPTITISSPMEGATHATGELVSASYQCADESGGSGLVTCTGTVATGTPIDTSTTGQHAFTVVAVDGAGNTSEVTVTYAVSGGLVFGGFRPPVANPPAVNTENAGRTIPLKWTVENTSGDRITDPTAVTSLASQRINCATATPTAAPTPIVQPVPGPKPNGTWHVNWKTPKSYACTCRRVIVTLQDGTTHEAYFRFR